MQTSKELPNKEGNQYRREDEVHQRVGHEDHTETDDSQSHAKSGQIKSDTIFQLFGLQAEEQCDKDSGQQPKEGVGEVRRNVQQAIATNGAVDYDGDKNGDQQRDETPWGFFNILLQRLEITEGRDEQQRNNEPNHQQLDDKQDDDENLKRIFPSVVSGLCLLAFAEQ